MFDSSSSILPPVSFRVITFHHRLLRSWCGMIPWRMRYRDLRAVIVRQLEVEAVIVQRVDVQVPARRVAGPMPTTIEGIIEWPREVPAD